MLFLCKQDEKVKWKEESSKMAFPPCTYGGASPKREFHFNLGASLFMKHRFGTGRLFENHGKLVCGRMRNSLFFELELGWFLQ